MRWELVLSTLILVGALAPGARADVTAAPNFSTEETQTIARNELLRDIVQGDPWLVRQLLDMASRAKAATGSMSPPSQVDPKLDPDLAISPRDAQGIVEWNQLIRRAKLEKEQRGKALELFDPAFRRGHARHDRAGAAGQDSQGKRRPAVIMGLLGECGGKRRRRFAPSQREGVTSVLEALRDAVGGSP